MHKAGSFITLTGATGVDLSTCVLPPGRSLTLDADQWLEAMEHARLVCYQLRRRTKMRAWQRLGNKSQIKSHPALKINKCIYIFFLKAACSAVFFGTMLLFSLLRGRSDVYVLTETVSPHRVPVGSTPAMTGGRAMGERQQKKSDSRWQRQHKHLRVRTPPWKESEGCLFSGAAKGCPLWDSQADGQRGVGNRLQTTLQSSVVRAHRLSTVSSRTSKIETLSLFFSLPSCKY